MFSYRGVYVGSLNLIASIPGPSFLTSKARGFKWFLWAVQTLFHVSSSQDQRETCITKTCPCNKQTDFFSLKNENFQQKKIAIVLIFDQNINCGYTLEPPRRGPQQKYRLGTISNIKLLYNIYMCCLMMSALFVI